MCNRQKIILLLHARRRQRYPKLPSTPTESTQRINLHYRYNTTARSERKRNIKTEKGRKRETVGRVNMMIFYVPIPNLIEHNSIMLHKRKAQSG